MELKELFLAQLNREAEATRKAIERAPEGRNDWKPHEKSMPMGHLAALVATMPGWVAFMIERDELNLDDPANEAFHFPNEITQSDFAGWVQERGLYFMDPFDAKYTPLLASNDPGEPPQKGGLLLAPYGKGNYIYTGYAFFRQLPFGVPGAIRLYVNLLSVGHAPR